MIVEELLTKVGFKVDKKGLADLDRGVTSIKASLLGLSATVLGGAGSLFALVKTTADYASTSSKLAQRLGITTDAVQKLQYASSLAGMPLEEMEMSFNRLAKNIHSARLGEEAAIKVMKHAGFTSQELVSNNLTVVDIMMKVADQFKKMPDGVNKSAVAMELFGRSGTQMIPILNKGSEYIKTLMNEADSFGLVLSKDVVEASKKFNFSLKLIMQLIKGLRLQIGSALIPQVTDLINTYIEWIKNNRELIKTKITAYITLLSKAVGYAFKVLKEFIKGVMTLVKLFGGLERVLKFIVWAFLALTSVKILYGLGLMATGIMRIITGLKLANIQAALLNLKLLLIPTLIGAAIALAVLLIEDIIGYFQGKDSVTGLIIEKIKEIIKRFLDAAPVVSKVIKTVFGSWLNYLKAALDFVNDIFSLISKASNVIGTIFGPLKRLMGLTAPEPVFSPMTAAAPAIGAGTFVEKLIPNLMPSASNFNVNAPISVTVPPNTPPSQVGPYLQQGVKESLQSVLRETKRASIVEVAY